MYIFKEVVREALDVGLLLLDISYRIAFVVSAPALVVAYFVTLDWRLLALLLFMGVVSWAASSFRVLSRPLVRRKAAHISAREWREQGR